MAKAKKPMSVVEMARMGQRAFAEKYGTLARRAWGKTGGRPRKLDDETLARLRQLLKDGKTQTECAEVLGVSARTIGRTVARLSAKDKGETR
jgi:DNA invertase Pin-like site-specific DNA recombinase